jgi:hypothetical protein
MSEVKALRIRMHVATDMRRLRLAQRTSLATAKQNAWQGTGTEGRRLDTTAGAGFSGHDSNLGPAVDYSPTRRA